MTAMFFLKRHKGRFCCEQHIELFNKKKVDRLFIPGPRPNIKKGDNDHES
jgi:hypothetical protein